ncbi:MAG: hypothetical protein AB9M60_08295 [Leptothrix sp. (in: b-proteobacteria)]
MLALAEVPQVPVAVSEPTSSRRSAAADADPRARSGLAPAAPATALAYPSAVAADAPAASSPETRLRLDRLAAREREVGRAQPLFAPLAWRAPVQIALLPPAAPAPVPAPVAPPFPYPYIGGLTDEGQRTAFFSRGERVLALRAGETVDGTYRVDQVSPKQMNLTYLPLQQALTVTFGEPR